MRLLVVTQAVDTQDPVLGFFCRWIEEFAKKAVYIEVICLKEGAHMLPSNVRVHSLGKEKGFSRVRYVINFYRYVWQLRHDYDTVFVHMNEEYVLLGSLVWKLLNKKILLWRNHAKGSFWTRMSVVLADTVFCTSPQAYVARYTKAKCMPVGIDTDIFKPDIHVRKRPHSILFLGRIAPVKNIDVFVDALNELQKNDVEFVVTIAGEALERDRRYEKTVLDKVATYGLSDKIACVGAVTQTQALALYREHEIYVNLTPSGSMDKTIFEAMACGIVVLISNEALRTFFHNDSFMTEITALAVADKLTGLLRWSRETKECEGAMCREKVKNAHTLSLLIDKIMLA